MKKERKNWNGTIELRPHWSSHTGTENCPKSPPEAGRTIIFIIFRPSFQGSQGSQASPAGASASPSFQGIHLYMVYTGAEIAARAPPSELTACYAAVAICMHAYVRRIHVAA